MRFSAVVAAAALAAGAQAAGNSTGDVYVTEGTIDTMPADGIALTLSSSR